MSGALTTAQEAHAGVPVLNAAAAIEASAGVPEARPRCVVGSFTPDGDVFPIGPHEGGAFPVPLFRRGDDGEGAPA